MNLTNLSRTASGDHRGAGIENCTSVPSSVVRFMKQRHLTPLMCQAQKVVRPFPQTQKQKHAFNQEN